MVVKPPTLTGNDTSLIFGHKGNCPPSTSPFYVYTMKKSLATAPSFSMQRHDEIPPPSWGTHSFADVSRLTPTRSQHIPIPNSMKLVEQGDFYTVNIDDRVYQQGVDELKDCLIGRIMMSQGDRPYSTFELGFRLQNWIQDFNPNKACTSLAQVWVRILDLSMEYWQLGILEAMASAFGTLVKIDDCMLHRRMGHYARILVEIDMKTEIIEKIMYKRSGVCSFANLVFERLPKFCRWCGIVGHTTVACTRGRRQDKDDNHGRGRSSSSPMQCRSSSSSRN
ncbi:hypothetical protein ACS0TY_023903 [Phlomoides rotata]